MGMDATMAFHARAPRIRRGTPRSDAEAIAADWRAVGDYLGAAMGVRRGKARGP